MSGLKDHLKKVAAEDAEVTSETEPTPDEVEVEDQIAARIAVANNPAFLKIKMQAGRIMAQCGVVLKGSDDPQELYRAQGGIQGLEELLVYFEQADERTTP